MNNLLERSVNQWLNQKFDSYYHVSVFTSLPGNTDFEEILSSAGEISLKLKHQAASLAMATMLA